MNKFTTGQKASFKKTMTKEMVRDFAELTGDHNALHESPDTAKKRGHKDIVCHGLLVSGFYSAMAGMHLPGENSILMSTEFQYVLPVYPGDTLEYGAEVISVNEDFRFLDLQLNCANQEGKTVLRGKMRVGLV